VHEVGARLVGGNLDAFLADHLRHRRHVRIDAQQRERLRAGRHVVPRQVRIAVGREAETVGGGLAGGEFGRQAFAVLEAVAADLHGGE